MGQFELYLRKAKHLVNTHHGINFFLSISYFALKLTPYVCETIFESCELEWRETEILMLLSIFVAVKTRKSPSFNAFVNTLFTFSKVANIVLYWREGPLHTFAFLLCWFIQFIFFPEPAYSGPDNILHMRGGHLENEINADPRVTWLVCFHTTWSQECRNLDSVFADVSVKFGGLKNFKFAKFDCNLYPDIAAKFGVSTSAISKQLPTVILFEKSKETKRRPAVVNGSVYKFIFSYENMVKDFDLNKVYYECKQNPIQVKSGAKAEPPTEQMKKEN